MNKKGFTLIELLAVIVILAVIALISVPIILGIIDDAKKGAFEESARNTVKSAERYYATSNLKSIDAEGVCYVFNYSSDVTEKTLIEEGLYQIPTSELKSSGKKATDGKVTVCDTYSESELSDGSYTYVLRGT